MANDPKRVQSVFLAALEKPGSQRDVLLDRECGTDTELRQRVKALLKAHEEPGSFLDSPPATLKNLPVLDETVAEWRGTQVGPYKLLEQIGEGGFGVVFLAEQQQPVRRRVALKIIKPGMDTRQVIARFEAERQALALMDHPSIAKVLDAGSAEGGRPYFVMELVKGVSIIKYCDQCNLTTRERLELFIAVCEAVQHAHQKGIIHRDLKPSNVMIAMQDGKPTPKIIDFGVAKAINQRLTERTLMTGYAQILGTPLYMSPEQAELSPLEVDTRSDIYSLGVLLYELLTGTTPFEKTRLSEAGYEELRRIIREEEPPRPSQRLSTLEAAALTTIAEHRRSDPRKLNQLLRGEVDWIVMKCLEKERSRRYETVGGLALDLKRYLADEPVLACPPSRVYRLRKFARRNKAAMMTTAAVAISLVMGTAVAVWQAHAAGQAAKEAREQRAEAVGQRNATAAALRSEAEARREAEEARRVSEDLRRLAEEQRKAAEAQTRIARELEAISLRERTLAEGRERTIRRYLYLAHMNLAQQAVELLDPARATELLSFHYPEQGHEDLRGFEWYYWWGQCHQRLVRTLDGHRDHVMAVAYSPDGQTLASASADGTVKLWNTATEVEGLTLAGHGNYVTSVAFSPDGKTLASGSRDHAVRLWDTATGELKATFEGHGDWVLSVAFSSDGKTLASSSRDRTVKLWDVAAGEVKTTLNGHEHYVQSVALSPDGKWVASGTSGGEVRLWDFASGELKTTLKGHDERIWSLAFSPDAGTLAAAVIFVDSPSVVKLWDPATGELKATLKGHKFGLFTVAFSADGKSLASGGEDRTVKVWDVATGALNLTLAGHGHFVYGVAFAPDGKTVASASYDRTVKLWDVAASESKTLLGGGETAATYVKTVAFAPDGGAVASGRADGSVMLWDVTTGSFRNTFEGHTQKITSLAFSSDGQTLASASLDRTVKLWDVADGRLRLKFTLEGHDYWRSPVAISPRGDMVATAGDDHTAKLWDTATGELKATLKGHRGPILALAFSPDGGTLASGGSWDYEARLWDPATAALKATFKGHSGWIFAVTFSSDGRTLATAGEDATIKLWDVTADKLQATLVGHAAPVYSLAFCPDGKTLASSSYDQTIKLWDPAMAQPKTTLAAHGPLAVVFSPEGAILAAVDNGNVKLWRAASEAEVRDRSK